MKGNRLNVQKKKKKKEIPKQKCSLHVRPRCPVKLLRGMCFSNISTSPTGSSRIHSCSSSAIKCKHVCCMGGSKTVWINEPVMSVALWMMCMSNLVDINDAEKPSAHFLSQVEQIQRRGIFFSSTQQRDWPATQRGHGGQKHTLSLLTSPLFPSEWSPRHDFHRSSVEQVRTLCFAC